MYINSWTRPSNSFYELLTVSPRIIFHSFNGTIGWRLFPRRGRGKRRGITPKPNGFQSLEGRGTLRAASLKFVAILKDISEKALGTVALHSFPCHSRPQSSSLLRMTDGEKSSGELWTKLFRYLLLVETKKARLIGQSVTR